MTDTRSGTLEKPPMASAEFVERARYNIGSFKKINMSNVKIIAILIAVLCLTNHLVLSDYCYTDDTDPFMHFGSYTRNHIVRGAITNPHLPNCKLLQIWMLTRHSIINNTKYWSSHVHELLQKYHNNISENYDLGGVHLCAKDIEKLRQWKKYEFLDDDNLKQLIQQDKQDMFSLGIRFKNYFPNFFEYKSVKALKHQYLFRGIQQFGIKNSVNSFINGLFGNVTFDIKIKKKDNLLQFHKIYKPFLKHKSASQLKEFQKYIKSAEWNEMLRSISDRLGFSSPLPFSTIKSFYRTCTFETIYYGSSPWCAVFRKEDLEKIQYSEDLMSYYHSGYGQNMRQMIGCPMVKDLYNHFRNFEDGYGVDEPKGIFYFADITAIQLLLSTIGAAKDPEPLLAKNFIQARNRKWYQAHLTPLSANLVIMLFKCSKEYKVNLYLNEKPLDIDCCEHGICDWNFLRNKLEETVFNCKADICHD
ncbi:multiple inositol polyphosphate phosphatase 1-like isoform X1 [Apis florea]|uniref:multiple inositol polyphosphate phosphatase 1-like isoform X1 n=2 Tax=Apis florea TaxID=7463 RepID=UPI0006291E2F|nr:multiple inositol polyphosphate phosphatase 1-like isoform X1 [Apis florea]